MRAHFAIDLINNFFASPQRPQPIAQNIEPPH
jgi:hypothetical protein